MVSSSVLFISVLTLFCFILVGFILRKTNLVDGSFATIISVYVLYVAQAALLLHGFLVEFNKTVLTGVLWVFALSLLSHSLFYIIAMRLFGKAPDKIKTVLRFGIVFSNAGYMGVPIISDILGDEFVIYATFYIVIFNVFTFSIGRLIYTGDKKYISVKSIFINPAVIPIAIGFILFITGAGGWIAGQVAAPEKNAVAEGVSVFYNVVTTLKNTVAPASMMVIGCRLAEIDFKGIFKDKYLYPFLFIRHFAFPFMMWIIMKGIVFAGVISGSTADIVMAIVLVLSSTPSAAATTMFAELYGGDSHYAGKLVAISTLCSVVTMPVVAMLLTV